MGSINFRVDSTRHASTSSNKSVRREPRGNPGSIFPDTSWYIEPIIPPFWDHATNPELEWHDFNQLYNVKNFFDHGIFNSPLYLQFVIEIHGSITADHDHLLHMVQTAEKLVGEQSPFPSLAPGDAYGTRQYGSKYGRSRRRRPRG